MVASSLSQRLRRQGARWYGVLVAAALLPSLSVAAPAAADRIDRPATHRQGATTVQVFFSRYDGIDRPFDQVFGFDRRVSPVDGRVATAALEALIQGPTDEERDQGYSSELQGMLGGESVCDGPDFELGIDADGVATVRFCRALVGRGGIGSDAAIYAQVGTTLRQFPSVRDVRLIEVNGGCLGDQSGYEFCLQTNPLEPPLLDEEAPFREAVVRYDLLEARARAAEDPEQVRPRATERAVGAVRRLVAAARDQGEREAPLLEWITFCGHRRPAANRLEVDAIEVWSTRVYDRRGRLLRTDLPGRVAQTLSLVRDGRGDWIVDSVRYYAEEDPPSCG